MNKKVADVRANAVKEIILRDSIDVKRISVIGIGGTDIFNKNNRVMIYGEYY